MTEQLQAIEYILSNPEQYPISTILLCDRHTHGRLTSSTNSATTMGNFQVQYLDKLVDAFDGDGNVIKSPEEGVFYVAVPQDVVQAQTIKHWFYHSSPRDSRIAFEKVRFSTAPLDDDENLSSRVLDLTVPQILATYRQT